MRKLIGLTVLLCLLASGCYSKTLLYTGKIIDVERHNKYDIVTFKGSQYIDIRIDNTPTFLILFKDYHLYRICNPKECWYEMDIK